MALSLSWMLNDNAEWVAVSVPLSNRGRKRVCVWKGRKTKIENVGEPMMGNKTRKKQTETLKRKKTREKRNNTHITFNLVYDFSLIKMYECWTGIAYTWNSFEKYQNSCVQWKTNDSTERHTNRRNQNRKPKTITKTENERRKKTTTTTTKNKAKGKRNKEVKNDENEYPLAHTLSKTGPTNRESWTSWLNTMHNRAHNKNHLKIC